MSLPRWRRVPAQTLAWWKDVWRSRIAPEFDGSDRHGQFALALLVDDFWPTSSPRMRAQIGAEIRLQGVRFGLSPIDRRRLHSTLDYRTPFEALTDHRAAATAAA